MHSFILMARLDVDLWLGMSSDIEYRSYSAEELLHICDENELFQNGVEFLHWVPDQDFQEVFELDEIACLHKFPSPTATKMEPRFFGKNILSGPHMMMAFVDGSFYPFKKEDLVGIAMFLENKQGIWKDLFERAEPKTNYDSVDALIYGINGFGKDEGN